MSSTALPRLDVLLASTLYLMTRYHARRCPGIARAVAQHLDLLSRHADGDCSALLRSACAQLEIDWRSLTRGSTVVGRGRHSTLAADGSESIQNKRSGRP